MRTHRLLALVLLAVCAVRFVSAEEPPTETVDASRWELVWRDEFDREGEPDRGRWTYEEGFVRNGEPQYYTAGRSRNARVEKGLLVIEAHREKFPNPHYEGVEAAASLSPQNQPDYAKRANATKPFAAYTSASLTTQGRFEFRYGRVDIRARLPRGRGVWPALWTLGADIDAIPWPACGEIDIMEYVGFMPGVVHGNVHCPSRYVAGVDPEVAGYLATLKVPELEDDFHLYSLEWSETLILVKFDGKVVLRYPKQDRDASAWPFDRPMYLLLNLAVGGSWGGKQGVDDSIFPQRFEIDYVRIYSAKASAAGKTP